MRGHQVRPELPDQRSGAVVLHAAGDWGDCGGVRGMGDPGAVAEGQCEVFRHRQSGEGLFPGLCRRAGP